MGAFFRRIFSADSGSGRGASALSTSDSFLNLSALSHFVEKLKGYFATKTQVNNLEKRIAHLEEEIQKCIGTGG